MAEPAGQRAPLGAINAAGKRGSFEGSVYVGDQSGSGSAEIFAVVPDCKTFTASAAACTPAASPWASMVS